MIRLLLGYMQFYLGTLDTSKCDIEHNRGVVSPPYTSIGETIRKLCDSKKDATSIIINSWKILQTLLDLPKDAWKIVNDTLGLPEKKWKTFKDKCGNG